MLCLVQGVGDSLTLYMWNVMSTLISLQEMEGLVAKGLVKAIGISNFTITKTENLLKTAKIVPAVNQVESHPHFQQQKLKDYCDSKGMCCTVAIVLSHRIIMC